MAGFNRITLIGRPMTDPESRSMNDGSVMSKFRLSVSRPQSGADLIDIVVWGKAAEICRDYLKKNNLVLVEGRIQNRSFDDQSGQRRWVTEVVANAVTLMDKATRSQPSTAGQPVEMAESAPTNLSEEPEPMSLDGARDKAEDADLINELPF